MDDIQRWLERHGLGKYADVFAANEIDWAVLPRLTDDDLRELGLPVGARRRMQAAIQEIGRDQQGPFAPALGAAEGERRQLTVMFADLVGSTALSQRLDPELLRDALRAYQAVARSVVAEHRGYIAQYMGDGIMAYFGYPVAGEDDAERAVAAGLELTRRVPEVTVGAAAMAVRVGIATGPVVGGDVIGEGASQQNAVVGETPNLAARLQGEAAPNSVVVSTSTRELVRGLFELERGSERMLKGFDRPQTPWHVTGARPAESRFAALRHQTLSDFVGRRSELDLLLARWESAVGGEGQVVLLGGEPGIGKSRLAEELRRAITAASPLVIRYQCSPHHANSAFHPFIEQLQRAAGFIASDGEATRLAKLEALVETAGPGRETALAMFASLLSLPATRYPALELSPPQLKAATVSALGAELLARCARGAVLVLFEDAHWADPTSRDVLDVLVDVVQRQSVLCVITHRPEFTSAWEAHGHVTHLRLNRLTRRDGMAIIRGIAGGKIVPDAIAEQILEKTDGVPLFVEELTRTVLEGGALQETATAYVLEGSRPEPAIPSTLRDSLMARLDRLASVKEIAQVGACIGREFSHALIEQVAGLAPDALGRALEQLEHHKLLFRRGAPPAATYTFKHALVQETAYASLLSRRRVAIHRRIAEALEQDAGRATEINTPLLAHHWHHAGAADEAIKYWIAAAQSAAKRSANREAIAHYRSAQRELSTGEPTDLRARRELETWVGLGPVLMATHGPSSPEAAEAYRSAAELGERLGDRRQRFLSTFGLWHLTNVSGRPVAARRLADALLDAAARSEDAGEQLQAHHASWSCLFTLGHFDECQRHIEAGRVIYDETAHADHKLLYGGHDPAVCSHLFDAWVRALRGDAPGVEEAVDRCQRLADRLQHKYTISTAYFGTSAALYHLGAHDDAFRHAARGLEISAAHGLRAWMPVMELIQAVVTGARAPACDLDEPIGALTEAFDRWRASGAGAFRSWFHTELARLELKRGRLERAREHLESARRLSEEHRDVWYLPETLRLEAQHAALTGGPETAFAALGASIAMARTHGAWLLALRAATDLARVRAGRGQRAEGARRLAEALDELPAGSRGADRAAAEELLRELA
jgi:class 3 adenylate cyclase/tetratricopeptide (TPR) repeat protein